MVMLECLCHRGKTQPDSFDQRVPCYSQNSALLVVVVNPQAFPFATWGSLSERDFEPLPLSLVAPLVRPICQGSPLPGGDAMLVDQVLVQRARIAKLTHCCQPAAP